MALEQNILTESGLNATYWIVAKIEIDKIAEQGLITMYGYLNEDHRRLEAGYLEKKFINVYPDIFNETFNLDNLKTENPYELAYGFVKTLPQFERARDIFDKKEKVNEVIEPEEDKEESDKEIEVIGNGKHKQDKQTKTTPVASI